jgi:hypothetical protein
MYSVSLQKCFRSVMYISCFPDVWYEIHLLPLRASNHQSDSTFQLQCIPLILQTFPEQNKEIVLLNLRFSQQQLRKLTYSCSWHRPVYRKPMEFRRNTIPPSSGSKRRPSKESAGNIQEVQPWRWRRYLPRNRQITLNGIHGVISYTI